jgi:hypothetical protein
MSDVDTALKDMIINLEMTVDQVNALLNLLNTPYQTPTLLFSMFINLLQSQATPQVQQAQAATEAALAASANAETPAT